MIYSIQYLRFFLALSVAILHFHSIYAEWSLLSNIAFFGVAVDIFFVISGFTLAISLKEELHPGTYVGARFKRIFPIYLLFTIPAIILSFILVGYSIRPILDSLLLVPTSSIYSNHGINLLYISQAWTLQFDFVLFYCFAIFLYFNKNNRAIYNLFYFLIIITILTLLGVRSEIPFLNLLFDERTIFIEYAAGIAIGLLYKNRCYFNYKNNLLSIGCISLGIILIIILDYLFGHSIYRGVIYVVPSCLILIGCLYANIDKGLSLYLGSLSFPIYISHSVTVFGFAYIMKYLDTNIPIFIIFITSMVLMLIVGIIVNKIDTSISLYIR